MLLGIDMSRTIDDTEASDCAYDETATDENLTSVGTLQSTCHIISTTVSPLLIHCTSNPR